MRSGASSVLDTVVLPARQRTAAYFGAAATSAVAIIGVAIIALTGIKLFHTFWGDPTIYLVYAKNLAHGHIFSFNPGQFSSGTTSPLWALILGTPYVLGFGASAAKVVSLAVTAAALLVVAWVAARLTRSAVAGILGSLVVIETVTFWGVMMYESALALLLIAAACLAGDRVVRSGDPTRPGAWAPLLVVWSAIPLVRPDAAGLVVIQASALLWVRVPVRVVVAAGLAAAVPAAAYFGYSKIVLGAFSVSSASRTFALQEYARELGPFHYSAQAVDYVQSHWALLLLSAVGLALYLRDSQRKWLALFGLAGILYYVVVLVVVSPVTWDAERYFVPSAALVAVGLARLVHEGWPRVAAGRRPTDTAGVARQIALTCAGVLAMVLVVQRLDDPYTLAKQQASLGYTFDAMVERDVADAVNRIVPRGSSVLGYEAQDRYYMRADIRFISLDGITDGKVIPYLRSGDMRSFLLRYRPRYWIMNNAPTYRPYLEESILRAAFERLATQHRAKVTLSGIGFRVVVRRPQPFPKGSTAWWQAVVRLRYPSS